MDLSECSDDNPNHKPFIPHKKKCTNDYISSLYSSSILFVMHPLVHARHRRAYHAKAVTELENKVIYLFKIISMDTAFTASEIENNI